MLIRSFLLFLMLMSFGACTKKDPIADNSQTETGNSGDNSGHTGASGNEDFLVFNAEARVSVSTLSIGASTIVTGINVPQIMLKKTKADYVKILRCKSDYELRGPTGELMQELQTGPKALDNLGYVWSTAFGNNDACHVVGVNIVDESPVVIEDLAAPTGYFYYVINPCVTQARSLNFREGCSNSLVVTRPIQYTAALQEDVLKLSKNLAAAQDKVNAITTEVKQLINRLRNNLQACEDLIAHDNQMQTFLHGLMTLGLMIGFAIVAVGLGFGFSGALMGIMMGPMLTEQILAIFKVPLPHGVENQCISTEKPDERYQVFKISELQEKLTTILGQPGPLSKAQDELSAILTQMHAAEQRTMSVDQAIAKMGNRGVDMKNLKSVISAIEQAQGAINSGGSGSGSSE